ncbi:helix-turn-helix transcriptional regulator [Streptomyces sp. NBC_01451]|uniref:helix-turn-helix transcriptional regulator n=1 Tax=Streptomyces sp. NBC_01451 TaxID=2903872 RepID=UPI002E37522C|nr:AAA family ATPase [Streptomyces sp. NBC_01451]
MSLVERDELLDLLSGLMGDAMRGRGRTALVGGAVAVGKSALLEAFADEAVKAEALTLVAAGSESESDIHLGVMGQLLQDAPLTAEERLKTDGLFLAEAGGRPVAHESLVDPRTAQSLCAALLALSARQPLAIVVDDAHHADQASQACLSYLVRRIRTARIMVCFGHSEQAPYRHTGFRLELLRRPGNHNIRVPLLTGDGVAAMAASRLGSAAADRIAADSYAVSGGNPSLLDALLADHRTATYTVAASGTAPRAHSADLVVADGYGHAVVSCLRRGGPRTLAVARGLAVLGSSDTIERLLGVDAESVAETLGELTTAGLLTAGNFRHPVARSAVLRDMDSHQRAELHQAAAALTYGDGAPATVVAEHLVAAPLTAAPWTLPVLEQAAELALSEGLVERAVEYLKLACSACSDERRLARLRTALVRAEWRVNPGTPAPHLADLVDSQRQGHLRGDDALILARALLWHGRFEDARDVLIRLGQADAARDPETASELRTTRPWLHSSYAPFLEYMPEAAPEQHSRDLPSFTADHRLEAANTLDSVLSTAPSEQVLARAERVLRRARLDEAGMDTVESALLALTYGERSSRAAPWCDGLIEEAVARQSPGRQARLLSIRAEISLRQGDLAGAERHARQALRIIPVSSWGVPVGSALASLLLALTAMGKYEEAADQLARPAPDTMLQSRYGLHYLHARGRYQLDTGNLDAALSDFRTCGDLMVRWGLDAPGFIAWRNESAEVLVQHGSSDEARRLLEDQLALCGTTTARARGAAQRILASTAPLRQRPPLLRQAVDLLQNTGDRYELARALTDLTRVYFHLGELRLARLVGRRTWDLVQQCQAHPLALTLETSLGKDISVAEEEPVVAGAESALSQAERRVVEMAARGCTNREIAKRLYITVSTVEQHLTRVYRKLNVTRAELSSVLQLNLPFDRHLETGT